MKKTVQKIPFLRLSIAFAAGIVAGLQFNVPTIFAAGVATVLLIISFIVNRFYKFGLSIVFGIGINLFFIFLGVLIFNLHNHKPRFYSNGNYTATILEAPVQKNKSWQSVIEVQAVQRNDSFFLVKEKILTYFAPTPPATELKPGDVILFNQSPQQIKNNGNPYEFDYKKYLERDKIYRQVYLPAENWHKTNLDPSFSLQILAEKIRLKLLNIYRAQELGKNEMDILAALTLGYKREIDPETKQVFSSAGAMHILAVSGLHVGIIYFILNFLIGFLRRQKAGKVVYVLIIITALWVFAFVTGLSPSVSRAATMFTFVVIGNNLQRQTNIYNSLAGSALFLLLLNPNNLFNVGFQLSYSAVFGIIFLQPRLQKLMQVRQKFPNYFWQLLTVSVAAQIATFPLSLYYFNQFPTWFWISNLFVIPAVFVLIPLGFALLLFHAVPFLGVFLAYLANQMIFGLYFMLQKIESLPFSTGQFVLSSLELALLLGLLLSVFIFIEARKKIYFKAVLVFLLLVSVFSFVKKINRLQQKQLIVYNDSANTIVHLISGKENYVISTKPLNKESYSMRIINNTVKKLQLEKPNFLNAGQNYFDAFIAVQNNLVVFHNKTILLHPDVPLQNFTPEIVINPKSDLQLKPTTQVVLNKRNYSKKNEQNTHQFDLQKEGAYLKKW